MNTVFQKKQRFPLFVLATISFFLIVLLLASCKEKTEKKPIRIATSAWPGIEFLHLAERKGFFKEEGANIQLVRFSTLDDSHRSYERGQVDGMAGTPIEALQARDNGHDSSIILISDYTNGADVIIARSGIARLKDLKGAKVGGEPPFSFYLLSLALRQEGLSLDDIQLTSMSQLNLQQSFIDGKLDAFHTYVPFASETLKKTPGASIIFDSSRLETKMPSIVVVRPDIVRSRPEAVRAFRRAWQKAFEFAQTHQDEAIKVMAEVEGVSPKDFATSLRGDRILSLDEQDSIERSDDFKKTLTEAAKVLKKIGMTNEEVSIQGFEVQKGEE